MAIGLVITILTLQMEAPSHRQVIQLTSYSVWTLALSYNVNHCVVLLFQRGFLSLTKEVV